MILKDRNYFISKKVNERFKKNIDVGDYKFQYNDRNAFFCKSEEKTIIIFGFAVDSLNSDRTIQEIASELIQSQNVIELVSKSKKLAGRFVIVYKSGQDFIVLPDATASIHVAYTIQNELKISSNPKLIADNSGYNESEKSKEIKSEAAEMHPLPYEMSMYDEIKLVNANHYLDCRKRIGVRYYPLEKKDSIKLDDASRSTIELLSNIAKGYIKNSLLSIPLTSGIDSRTVLSLFKDDAESIPLYTFYHDSFSDNTSDIVVPKEISKYFNLDYYCIKDLDIPEKVYNIFSNELGSNINNSIARNAYTYSKSNFAHYTFLSGDIIPLVKSSFGRNIPEAFATHQYLVTKTHNYSYYNKLEVKRWVKDIKPYARRSNISMYDLFFWEHRVGKWTANNLLNYDILTDSLNPFNCREIIETWLLVPRVERTKYSIHKDIIMQNWNELLKFPINPDRKNRLFYNSSLLFYVGSLVKYNLNKRKY